MSPDLKCAARAESARPARAAAVAPTHDGMASPAGLAPGARVGDWTLGRRIGAGGMGTVHTAVHTIIGKHAALKVARTEPGSDPHVTERFVQEARAVNQIRHPNIVDIFSIGWLPDGRPYLVMEFLCGRTLARRLADGRPRPDEAIAILLAVTEALTAAHAHGIVHRDLKPDNVFLAQTAAGEVVKVIDWGLSDRSPARTRSARSPPSGRSWGPRNTSRPNRRAATRSIAGPTSTRSAPWRTSCSSGACRSSPTTLRT